MVTSTQWQLSIDAATRYEQTIVPHILDPFARALVDWASLPTGATVIDIGCGTGAATRFAAERVEATGRIIGVDINAGMIAQAKSIPTRGRARVEWHEQSAYQLPVPDQSVDAIISAQVVQFLQDKPRAFVEMGRALKPGGKVTFSVWCAAPESPYFYAQVEAVATHIGADAAAGLWAGFTFAEPALIQELLHGAGFIEVEVSLMELDLPLPNLEEFIPRHIYATPLAALYKAAPLAAQRAVIDEMMARLSPYILNPDTLDPAISGRAQVPFRAYIASATNRH